MASENDSFRKQSYDKTDRAVLTSNRNKWSIPRLFQSLKHKRSTDTFVVLPTSKRRKFGETLAAEHSFELSPTPRTIGDMYNFSSSAFAHNGDVVVDLTSPSPPGPVSPNRKARRLSLTARVDNSSPVGGVKRLAVKNFRTDPRRDPGEYCDKALTQLLEGVTAIFEDRQPGLSNEELYRAAENLCKLGRADELTKKLLEKCKQHILTDFKGPLSSNTLRRNIDILQATLEAWATWNKQLVIIRAIFCYLDRAYLLKEQRPSIYESAVSHFCLLVFKDAQLRSKVIDGAYELLLAERTGSIDNQILFQDAVKMFHDLQVYNSDFEPYMLTESQSYIHTWADRESSERELPSYVAEAVAFMDAEMRRCDQFDLDTSTRRALLTLLEDHLIERKEAELTNHDAVADLLDENDKTATLRLEQLFSLLQRRRIGMKLKPAFSKWIDDTGSAIVFDEKEQDIMVSRLLALKQKLDNIWRISFHKNEELGHALRESFETFINKSKKTSATWNTDNSKPGEMVAKYVDMLLRTGAKAIPLSLSAGTSRPPEAEDEPGEEEDLVNEDAEVNNQLDQVLDLFRFVQGKAVFEAFYKKDLARRLLMGRSASADAEKNMLARLKTECGAGFTQNLEQMFKDVELAREEMNAYRNRLQNSGGKVGVDLTVNILSAAAWPSYPDIPVAIPSQIKQSIDEFENHYYQKHSGRKLQWKHALAHCQMKASFPKGDKELVVSSFQAIVLILFNRVGKDEHLTYEHIKSESGLAGPELIRTLQSLACAKLRPLSKYPKGRDVNPRDTFTINTAFSHPKYRIKINSIQLKETKEENKETHVRVAADRQFETQAAIVRIMKSRKTITHVELVAEVIGATRSRGVMGVGDIKKNIDKLIEKEYIERGEGNTYSYLA